MTQYVIIVESGNRGAEILSFQSLGYEVILITSGIVPYDSENIKHAIKVITDKRIVQFDFLSSLINEIKSEHMVKTIVSTSDFFIYPVSLICEKYNYSFLSSESSFVFHYKDEFRRKQNQLSFAHPKFYSFSEIKEALDFYRTSQYKQWVFKPVNGNESVGVKLINNEQELNESFKKLKNISRFTGNLYQPTFLLEEYIEGNIYSCEFIVANDQIQILGVTNRLMSQLPYFIELGYTFPVNGPIVNRIVEETKRFVNEFQYNFGPCHIEFIVTEEDEVYILEVNPRLIGPPNPWMIDRALNISVFDQVCALFITGELAETNLSNPRYSVCLEITSPVAGNLCGIKIHPSYLNHSDVNIIFLKEINQYVTVASSNTDIIARILTVADSVEIAQDLAMEIYKNTELEMKIQPKAISFTNSQ